MANTCVICGGGLPEQRGPGRPRRYCQACEPGVRTLRDAAYRSRAAERRRLGALVERLAADGDPAAAGLLARVGR